MWATWPRISSDAASQARSIPTDEAAFPLSSAAFASPSLPREASDMRRDSVLACVLLHSTAVGHLLSTAIDAAPKSSTLKRLASSPLYFGFLPKKSEV